MCPDLGHVLSSARSFLFWFPIPLERGFLFLRFPILPNRFPIPLEGFPIYGFPISLEPPRMVSYLRYGVSYYSRAGFLFLRFPISHSFLFYAGRQYLYRDVPIISPRGLIYEHYESRTEVVPK